MSNGSFGTVKIMGQLLGIARVARRLGPLIPLQEARVTATEGIEGDFRGVKPGRQITILFREGWEDACAELGQELPWVTRRANLFVEGVITPHEGGRLKIGSLLLEVTQETQPCQLMDKARQGLRAALKPHWRGGVCCRVVEGGTIHVGDGVESL